MTRLETVPALQAALAAEHAAVYAWGVVGARIQDEQRPAALVALTAHRAQRDALTRLLLDREEPPLAAEPAYALPFPVSDTSAAVRLGVLVEEGVAEAYADLVAAGRGELRTSAATRLQQTAVRAAAWRGSSLALPGLRDRSTASAMATATATPS
jgi:hypothetical protein